MDPSSELGIGTPLRNAVESADFLADFAVMSQFGATDAGGVERQAATAADAQTRRWLAEWLRGRGFAAVRELADRYDDRLHTSCGQLTVFPNSPVVVAREVQMHLDLRSPDDVVLAEADEVLRQHFSQIEVKANVRIEKRHAHTWAANFYQSEGVELARSAVEDLGFSNVEIRTRAGHDSTNMKDLVPSIMLFIPSVDGISHSELEFTHDRDLCNGVDLVAELLLRMTRGDLVTHAGR